MKSIEEFETWYRELGPARDEDDYWPFVWELMRAPHTAWHYALMVSPRTPPDLSDDLWSRFDEHADAETFLLEKFASGADAEQRGRMLFVLGKIADLKRGGRRDEIYALAKNATLSADGALRENAIIVLGWLGGAPDLAALGNTLLLDPNPKCRAWSASAFMQMGFRKNRKTILAKAAPWLSQALQTEKDLLALGAIIETVQELAQKKLGITRRAIDTQDAAPIEAARAKAARCLEKL